MNGDRHLASYDYFLSPQCIAQHPVVPRDHSRLLVVSSPQEHHHSIFKTLPQWLEPGDLLVLNNTQVIPARLYGRKHLGSAAVEALLLQELSPQRWLALLKPGKRFQPPTQISFTAHDDPARPPLLATVVDRDEATGGRILEFQLSPQQSLWSLLEHYGHIPFPPYITASGAQPEQYQTIYSQIPGAIAAPTAGLHFTEELFELLEARGIRRATVTLHVGVGTFRPVEVTDITKHTMHQEWVELPEATVAAIRETQARGGRILAVGTTVVRTLEGVMNQLALENGGVEAPLQPFQGQINLFIYPGYQWRIVQGLITNFHLPKSSLLMLVSALIGRERLLNLYQQAIAANYRFYSFGDAMLILPTAVST